MEEGHHHSNKILITGGSGFVGKELIKNLQKKGYHVHILTRKKTIPNTASLSYFEWNLDASTIDIDCFKNVNTIIHLAGANIGQKRWTNKRKIEIMQSRVQSTALLFENVKKYQFPIEHFVAASATGFYGAVTQKHIFTEEDQAGHDFLADVCKNWEHSSLQFLSLGTQVTILRMGVIIGNGGLLARMNKIARYGINPGLGNGLQYLPWVSLKDTINAYLFMIKHKNKSGIYNLVADEHLQMNDLARLLLRMNGHKRITPNVPSWVIQLIFGNMSQIMLKGSRVSNQKIKSIGYEFKHSTLKEAIQQLE